MPPPAEVLLMPPDAVQGDPAQPGPETVRFFQFFNHYLKDASAPKWITDGVPFLEKDANRSK